MPGSRKYYAPAISLFLVVCILLLGCSALIQPGREDLAGASCFVYQKPVSMTVSLEAVNGDSIMYYDSTIKADGSYAEWDGKATVYFHDTYFTQQCRSLTDGSSSVKQWRGVWVTSNCSSPSAQVQKWLQDMLISGSYDKRPVIPQNESKLLAGADEATFAITLYGREVDWRSFCDADFDSLFGGEALLGDFVDTDVTLFFHTESLTLTAIRLEQNTDGIWLSGGIVISPASESPEIDLSELHITEGVLSEEWSMTRFDFLDKEASSELQP